MKKFLPCIVLLCSILLSGSMPSSIQNPSLQRELDALTKRGYTYRMLDNDIIELTDPLSGEKHLKSLREPSEATICAWAAQRGIPILEIDPNTIDTSKYTGWYNYWTIVPLGNGIGTPLLVGDINENGQADAYGRYLDTLITEYQTRLYEVDSSGGVFLRYQYVPRPGISRQFIDADRDSLEEVAWSMVGVISGYEQHSRDSLPIYRIYAQDRYYHNSDPGYTGNIFGQSRRR